MFKDVTPAIIFALGYEYQCYSICYEKKSGDGKITLKVSKELEERIIKILNEINKEWNTLINTKNLE